MNFVISLFGGFKSKMVKKHINLIVTGSSQADKALELYQLLKTEFDINVIVSENAKHFVHFPDDVVIYDKLYDTDQYEIGDETDSIIFRTNVALNLVYPATVDFIAKITHGIANDLPTTLFAIANAMVPTLIFPGHHTNFEKSPFYQRNIQIIHNTNPMVKVYDTFLWCLPGWWRRVMVVFMIHKIPLTKFKRVLKYNDWKITALYSEVSLWNETFFLYKKKMGVNPFFYYFNFLASKISIRWIKSFYYSFLGQSFSFSNTSIRAACAAMIFVLFLDPSCLCGNGIFSYHHIRFLKLWQFVPITSLGRDRLMCGNCFKIFVHDISYFLSDLCFSHWLSMEQFFTNFFPLHHVELFLHWKCNRLDLGVICNFTFSYYTPTFLGKNCPPNYLYAIFLPVLCQKNFKKSEKKTRRNEFWNWFIA
jgi:hypothetical protein